MNRLAVCSVATVAAALALASGSASAADAGTTTPITMAGQITLLQGTQSGVVPLAPPRCRAHQNFVATSLTGSPDPTATFANGVFQASFTPSWGAVVPLSEALSDGTTRHSQLAFAIAGPPDNTREGPLYGDAQLPAGVPVALHSGAVPVTVAIFAQSGHGDITFDVAVTGRCQPKRALPSSGSNG